MNDYIRHKKKVKHKLYMVRFIVFILLLPSSIHACEVNLTWLSHNSASPGTEVTLRALNDIEDNFDIEMTGGRFRALKTTGNEVVFVVPEIAKSGFVSLISEQSCSNSLWLSISETAIVASDPQKTLKDEATNMTYAGEYVLFQLKSGFSLDAAKEVAEKNGARIIGANESLNVYQASVSPETRENISKMIQRLKNDHRVRWSSRDIIINP